MIYDVWSDEDQKTEKIEMGDDAPLGYVFLKACERIFAGEHNGSQRSAVIYARNDDRLWRCHVSITWVPEFWTQDFEEVADDR